MTSRNPEYKHFILTLSCTDRVGIVHAVSGFLHARSCNIIESAQFGDASTGRFFMRVVFSPQKKSFDESTWRVDFMQLADTFQMRWQLHRENERANVMVMVSRYGHCLNDLLFRQSAGLLPMNIRAVVSNHLEFEELVTRSGLEFRYLPINKSNKDAQEQTLLEWVGELDIELIVLARYMQILSSKVCVELSGQVINIHHSFLPSFKGAKPYAQAFERGVKLIGATAHYVTPDLDEGPIIEQEVARVNHAMSPADLMAVGRDVECQVLARAVQWHLERRVLLNGHKTVVFR